MQIDVTVSCKDKHRKNYKIEEKRQAGQSALLQQEGSLCADSDVLPSKYADGKPMGCEWESPEKILFLTKRYDKSSCRARLRNNLKNVNH